MATRSVFVLATVVSIRDKFCYPCCTRCHKKVHTRTREDDITFWCEGCSVEYSTEGVQYRYRISVMASDRTQIAQITVFGSCLDRFFGTSATSFMRFVNSAKSDASSLIPWSRAVHQAMEQCFVGTLLQFGFRIHSPCRTASQVSRDSPFRLKNIVNKQRKSVRADSLTDQFPSLLACQILPCSSSDQSPTVFQILHEYLEQLHRPTPESLCLRSSQPSPLSQASYEAFLAARRASLQETRASSIYCTPQDFGSMITPLALTGSSQPSSGSVPTQGSAQGSDSKSRREMDHAHPDLDDPSSFPNEVMNSDRSHFPSVVQFETPAILKSVKPNAKAVENFMEHHFPHEWMEYDDFPSSEDLSAFLADLERDALGRVDAETIPSLHSLKHNCPLPSATSDAMTTEIATLKDVVCEMSRTSNAEDFTEFTDFPSSEDLDAFLADMELDCENIPIRKSLTPRTTATSAAFLNSKLHCKVEGSKCLVVKGHVVEDIENTYNAKISSESLENKVETSCDMGHGSNSFCAQEEARLPYRANCSSYSDKLVHENDCSDSQFLRDCESVLAEMTVNIGNEGRAVGKPTSSQLLKRRILSSQRRSISQNGREDVKNLSTRRSKPSCRSTSTEEFYEKDIVCNTPLRYEQTKIMRSRDDDHNANETDEGQQGNRLTSVDHHGNNEVSMLNDSCDMMAPTQFSPDLFSQSPFFVAEGSKTPDLFSSPGVVKGESRSRCTHDSATPDLFSSPTCFGAHARSCTKDELNSVSLFSSSECSHLSSKSPAQLDVCENEAASLSNLGHCGTKNEFNRNSLAVSFHSTPYSVCIPSRMLNKPWTPIQVSPLLASVGSYPCNDISVQGTPVLFSQLSNSSL